MVVFGGVCMRQRILCHDVAVITVTTHAAPADTASSSSSAHSHHPTYNPTLSYHWHRPEVYGRFPMHRVDHAAAKLVLPCTMGGPRMLIHGGMGPGGTGFLPDLHSLRLGDGDVMEWESLVVTGEIPPARGNHTLINVPCRDLSAVPAASSSQAELSTGASMDVLVMFGGHTTIINEANPDVHGGLNNNNQMWNDVHCLRLDRAAAAIDASSLSAFTLHFTWSKVRVDGGVPPTPRSSHSVCLITEPSTATTTARALQPLRHDHRHRMIVFGGSIQGTTKLSVLSDVHVLKINNAVTPQQPGISTQWQWQAPECSINPHPHTISNTDTPSDKMMLLLSPSSSSSSSLLPLHDANAMDDGSIKEVCSDGSDRDGSCTLLPDLLDLLLACQSSSSSSSEALISGGGSVPPGGGDVIFVVHPAEGTDDDASAQTPGTANHDPMQNPSTVRFFAHRAIVRARRYVQS